MNVFKNFSRNFKANRQSYLINMLGLVTGLACCLLIMMWVVGQLQTDRGFKNIDRIVSLQGYHEGSQPFGGLAPAVMPALKMERPEVEAGVRLCPVARTVKCGAENFGVTAYDADTDLFKIFSLDFIEGVPYEAGEKERCVLTRSAALMIFGDRSPLGQSLQFEFGTFIVCGVVKDMPHRRTVATAGSENIVFLPIEREGERLAAWYNNSYETYVLLRDMSAFDEFVRVAKDRAIKAVPEYQLYVKAAPLKDRYLYDWGQMKEVRLMGVIALVILLIACINFINLSTAAFARSAVQTSIRKLVGATRWRLVGTHLSNTFLLVVCSFILAFVLAYAIVPVFGRIIGSSFRMADLLNPSVLWIGSGLVFLTTLLAGLYPSFYLASFSPVRVLKGGRSGGAWSVRLRKTLVVVQFVVSITLIICTLVIGRQIRMYQKMDLGYTWDEVLQVSLRNESQQQKAYVLKEELQHQSGIKTVSASTSIPARIFWNGLGFEWEGKDPAFSPLVYFTWADADWAKVYDVRPEEGEFFTDDCEGIVINREMADLMGGGELVGKYLTRNGENMKIVGILDNFKFNDFKAVAQPLVIFPMKPEDRVNYTNQLSVRISGTDLAALYETVRLRAAKVFGEEPVVRFLDDSVQSWLMTEQQSARMVSFFTLLAIIISCLGLFGLATFMIGQKRKEIGVRRVNGAKVTEIVWLLNIGFMKPILIGFVIACPLAYYFMSRWLESYLQRTEMNWWIFVLSGILTLLVALSALLWRTIRAAMENPVNSLRSE